MEISDEGLHKFGYGTLSPVSIGLFGVDKGLMPHGHLITGCLPSYYRYHTVSKFGLPSVILGYWRIVEENMSIWLRNSDGALMDESMQLNVLPSNNMKFTIIILYNYLLLHISIIS
jgi:hypothetical protein